MAEAREIVFAIGIDDRHGVRQRRRRLMVIEHDHLEAEPSRLGERRVADRAAVDCHDQRRALAGEVRHRFDIGTVAFGDSVGDVDNRFAAAGFEVFADQRRAARAVDVIVAEDRDPLAPLDRKAQPVGRRLHIGKFERVRHQVAQGRIEIALDRLGRDAAPGEDAGDQLIVSADLRDGEGSHLARPVEPRPPRPAKRGGLDVEEETGCRHRVFALAPTLLLAGGKGSASTR